MSDMLLGTPTPEEAVVLSEEMRRAWVAFATDDDPGWPEFGSAGPAGIARRLDVPTSLITDPEAASRHIWEPVLG
ncbi:hypothetical protein [Pseudofrankia sp. BMG5.37]|uniref:hypothetical protein n=1 Tax=Pseudofrankia sp. BMG5.37 TaxID=3050035 RepID=UPI0028939F9A|nr:hypothetical protein [Pseudofrankia sp. BMG5.37]MDT3446881.1 hypothetical protein [Pseudofrankia sp. BMG5.37]